MGVAKPVQVSAGKTDPSQIYIQITNKDIYRLNKKVTPLSDVASLIASIQAANKVRLHNWTKVEKRAPRTSTAWAENAAIDDGSDSCLSGKLSPRPLMGSDPIAPRFRIMNEFNLKCDKLQAEGKLSALQSLYNRKHDKAQALEVGFETFQNTMHDTEHDWLELDRIQRLLDVVTAERNYAYSSLQSAS